MTLVCTERFSGTGLKEDFYDNDWTRLNVKRPLHENGSIQSKRPKLFDTMKAIAIELSKDCPFSRIDFYELNDEVYFGEITFYPASGFESFDPENWDNKLGDLLKISGGYLLQSNGLRFYLTESIHHSGLTDYKFYCFNGEPKYLYVSEGLENHATALISFLTPDWKFAKFGRTDYQAFKELPEKPKHYEEMLDMAKSLSSGHKFLRVDLYEIANTVYFSELTFSPCSGFMPFEPKRYDLDLGQELVLDNNIDEEL